ncbi:MAG TPA: NADH-quinone oxidoreductase subunit C [Actinomycetes bacterium]|nr:NADH-quinone oxidoreductase subunit C [Actinomycetes bacterium]
MTEPTGPGTADGNNWAEELERLTRDVNGEVTTAFGDVTVTVDRDVWLALHQLLRDEASLSFFDWLSAVDEGEAGFTVFCHLYDPVRHRHLLARTALPREDARLRSVTQAFRGAAWHERETAEMFGIVFDGHPHPARLLLSDEFDGHPLRKDFVLTARVSKQWPGAKEPGESGDGSPSRRRIQPPGIPDPSWGPHESGRADD